MRRLATAGVFATLLLAAGSASADDGPKDRLIGEPIDDGAMRYPPSSVRTGLILGGIAAFGISYGLSAMSAALWPEVPGSDWLYAPVIGPWGAIATNDCAPEDEGDCTAILVMRYILYTLDGFAQAGGVGLMGEGVFMTTEADAPAETSVMVSPIVTDKYTGIGLMGTF